MRVTVLGPLKAFDGARELDLGGPMNRALVARLAVDAGRPVSTAVLVDDLWGADVPVDATNALQSIVSRTRRRLPDGVLRSEAGGYALTADVDVDEFRRLVAAGRPGEALALWQGDVLADLRDLAFVERVASTLSEARLAVLEEDLGVRRPGPALVAELAELTRAHPYRDGLWLLHLRTLVACGRPNEALAEYERHRRTLADDLGTDPSPDLRQLHAQILRGEASPPERRYSRLPSALTSFVGRDDAVAELCRAVAEHRLVTVLGPGGAGKTRLAVETARACLDRPAFATEPARTAELAEAWFVELAMVTGDDDIVSAVLSAMGLLEVSVIERPGSAPPPGLREHLLDAVRDVRGLLVVDNCEHLVDGVAELVEQLLAHGPGLRVLATSREVLQLIGEFTYQLQPLTVPAESATVAEAERCSAVRLFVERARAVDHAFTLDEVTLPSVRTICRRLDGQPLALELAAARLRTLTAAEVADRLSDRFRLLTGGSRTLPRHRTLRAVVEWSYDLLDDRERDLAERVAVFPGGVTAASAAAVFDDAEDTAELLESLADKSLLVPVRGAQRFRMLETLREYGVERLVERGAAEKVRSAHLDHFVARAEEFTARLGTPQDVAAIHAYDVERANLTAALRFAIDRGDRARAGRLVRALALYWAIRNEHAELDQLLLDVVAIPGRADPSTEIALAGLELVGRFLLGARSEPSADPDRPLPVTGLGPEWQTAVRPILALWDAHRPADDLTAIIMAVLGHYGLAGDRVLPEPANPWVRSVIGLLRLALLENAGETRGTADLLQETVAGFRACGDTWGIAVALSLQGAMEAYDGAFDRAVAAWSEAIPLLERLGAEQDAAFCRLRVVTLGLVTADDDELALVRASLTRELEAAGRHGNRRNLVFTRLALGHLERIAGDHRASIRHLRLLLENLDAVDREAAGQFEAMARAALAAALAAAATGPGDLDTLASAEEELRVALRVGLGTQDMPVVAQVAVMAAVVAHLADDDERAARLLGVADALRGREDLSNRDARTLARVLRESLGAERHDVLYAEGLALQRRTAVHQILRR